jgi:hypothetical protein
METVFQIGTGHDYDWIDYWDDQCREFMEEFDPFIHKQLYMEWTDANGIVHKETHETDFDKHFETLNNMLFQGMFIKWSFLSTASKWKLFETKAKSFIIFTDDSFAVQIKLIDPFTMIQVDRSVLDNITLDY